MKWLFVRLHKKDSEHPFITQTYDDLEYAKAGCEYVLRKWGEEFFLLDEKGEVVYDMRGKVLPITD